MPFAFNAVELYVVTVNGKQWTRANEVCKALKYERRTIDILRRHVSIENKRHRFELHGGSVTEPPLEWPKTASQTSTTSMKKECMRCSLEVNSH